MARRSHRVWLSKLGCLAFKLNSELDKGSFISLEDACAAIEQTRVISFIKDRLGSWGPVSAIDAEDEVTISEYFRNASGGLSPSEVGVLKNGICWLLALTIEMMQQEDWTTFSDPTNP